MLVYRAIGLPLGEIRTLLDDADVDVVAHLQRQHTLLTEQADRRWGDTDAWMQSQQAARRLRQGRLGADQGGRRRTADCTG